MGACSATAATAPAAAAILAMALRAACGSTTPGMSASARNATSSPVASGDVSFNGRSMPAENVTSMVSPQNSKSMRSPGE
ncbi:Uncharacterised protein [Mycobacterium tuberculosis]|nr:Uncharacterised protein [Mycobacterium tuberculosis]CNV07329.1 Uncharacterised protein [Mycobacterium tuberculosis]CNY84317.1 Uncharacterised protein [Mycobacterium tuberculosis]CNZ33803.1 Uncharacterised protein [Mycobacterium tuberculosis]CNZ48377.1 Uncharacterised protein [Mycobacterium tuberculosis]